MMLGKRMTCDTTFHLHSMKWEDRDCGVLVAFPSPGNSLKITATCCNLVPSLSQRISARCLSKPRDKSSLAAPTKEELGSNRRCTLTTIFFLSWWQYFNKWPSRSHQKPISAHVVLKCFQQLKLTRSIYVITKKKKSHQYFQFMSYIWQHLTTTK